MLKNILLPVLIIGILVGCDVSVGGKNNKYSQKIFLPHDLSKPPSIELAEEIGRYVFPIVERKIKSNPEKYPLEKVNVSIMWGQINSLVEGKSRYYINVKGRSSLPIDENSELKEIMQYAIKQVNLKMAELK